MTKMNNNHKVILFDGICNLCNASVNFIIKRDKNDTFRFAALQSDVGKKLVLKFNIDTANTDSIILIDEDKSYIKSTAALHISKTLSGGYPLFFAFIIIPQFLRNWVYDYIAKNRYKWYGKKESCMIPTPTLKDKFL
jgi:predicted DCC family thiol-disulfide oxidoreductase YuxK